MKNRSAIEWPPQLRWLGAGLALVLIQVGGWPALAFADTHNPATIRGAVRVIDGDTLEVGGQRIRLEGIDAPESSQTCQTEQGDIWNCGAAATAELRLLTNGRTIVCDPLGKDKYGRILAHCFDGSVNLNAAMVRRGFAWAFVKYAQTFVADEAAARRAGAGVWQGPAVAPWDYRGGVWQTAEVAAPQGCAIKGNISNQGQIYHMPWSPWYGKVQIDEQAGERWFCSETEAIAAGWRPVRGGG